MVFKFNTSQTSTHCRCLLKPECIDTYLLSLYAKIEELKKEKHVYIFSLQYISSSGNLIRRDIEIILLRPGNYNIYFSWGHNSRRHRGRHTAGIIHVKCGKVTGRYNFWGRLLFCWVSTFIIFWGAWRDVATLTEVLTVGGSWIIFVFKCLWE